VPGLRREDFPVLDRLTYLNTASAGLVPASVVTPAHQFELGLAQAGTTGMDEETEIAILDDARDGAAALLHAGPDTIAIATSFTEALNQVAWWLRPGRGQNVVSSEVDFPSVTYPWHRIAEDTGCEVRLVGMLGDPDSFDVNKIADSVDSATAAICISHVQYLTGHVLDLRELAALAHGNGAVLIVDATQSAGQVPIDVTASGVDVLIAGSYKWLCSTFGAAICYLSPSLLSEFRPPLVGWRSTEHPYSLDARWLPLAATARRMEYSTMSYAAAIALGRAIGYIRGLSLDEVAAHNRELASELVDGLAERGARLLTPRDPARRAGAVTARFPGRDGEAIAAALTARGVIVSPRVGSTRFSAHFYNSSDDVGRALSTLDDLLR
ncbi:MAG TPA: aminotransferase class V-fold PLP-dependent enzyme, partial [Streptosporangiaceae bacterium]|nr:aminotransferase class V-fold PLP-dependent enzyme [Streptosporangiaceae bacterium]